MIDWDAILDKAQQHEVRRLDPPERYLPELMAVVADVPVQIWTDPFGRGYQYEFELAGPEPEISLLVELSAVVELAAVYFARRTRRGDGGYRDECGDSAFRAEDSGLRDRVLETVRGLGFTLVPYAELDAIRRGKPTYCWLFSDSEE